MIVEIDIKKNLVKKAQKKADELGELKNSITHGDGNLVGFLGEFIVADYFGGKVSNTYDYDIIINEKKIDVKTKRTNYPPKESYYATVAAFNTEQKCDSYYFVRIDLDKMKAYLLGGLSKQSFYKKAKFFKKGEIDSTGNFGWTFKADCYNVLISDLK